MEHVGFHVRYLDISFLLAVYYD